MEEVATAADVYVAARGVGVILRNFVHPVHVRIEVGVVARARAVYLLLRERQRRAVLSGQLVEQRHVVGSIQELRQLRGLVDAVLHVEAHLRGTNLTALRRDDDHAVGTAYTIHGRGRSILQHRERLNLGNVDVVEVALHAVNQDERLVTAREGRDTANPEVRIVVARLTRTLDADDARELTGEVVRQRARRTERQLRGLDGLDGADDGGLLLAAVARHHHFFHLARILVEHDVQQLRTAHLHHLLLEADVVELQRTLLVARDVDVEHAVYIGHRADVRVDERHRHADERLLGSVGHLSGHLRSLHLLLRGSWLKAHAAQHRQHAEQEHACP